MNDPALLFQLYGVPGIVLIVFAKRMGVPLPAMPFLLLAGARGAQDPLFAASAGVGACAAAVLADAIWFAAGRRFGRRMLSLMCRLSMSPDTCIRKSEVAFTRRGDAAVLLAKFIPGVAGLAPPLAGALGMAAARFTLLNLAGTMLWVGAGLAAGRLAHREVMRVVAAVQELGTLAVPLLAAALAAYVAWLAARRALMRRAASRAPRLAPSELAAKIARGERVLLVDVRGPMSTLQQRIPGAVHAVSGPELDELAAGLDPSVQLVVYCDCPADLSAARVAATLRNRGWPAHVLAGGLPAWLAAGLPVEPVGGGLSHEPAGGGYANAKGEAPLVLPR